MTPEQERQARADGLTPYTVIYVVDDESFWQFFECWAEDGDHAEEQAADAELGVTVLWVNEGHGPHSRLMQGMEE